MSLQYSPRLKDVINKSKLVAKENGRNIVHPMDLFLSCLNSGFDPVIMFIDFKTDGYSEFLQLCIDKCNSIKKDSNKRISWTKESILSIDSAESEAKEMNSSFVGVEHLFSSLLKNSSQVRRFLDYIGINNKEFRQNFLNGPEEVAVNLTGESQSRKESNGLIEDISERIYNNNFKFHGRREELEKMMSILCRRKKSNVLLLGEPGVGKTALVEGLVDAMNNPPQDSNIFFVKMDVFELNISNLVSDTLFRGQFEKKLNDVLDQLKNNEGKAVLFIDEFHMAMKAGDNAEGSLNVVNILKPPLANGDISLIAATTFSEFKKYVEKDPALVRRFEIINVSEPSKEETFDILWNCKSIYEDYHSFTYSKNFVKKIIDVSDKYLPYKKFPDKAFEVLDDISSQEKLEFCKRPKSLNDIENLLIMLTEQIDSGEITEDEAEKLIPLYNDKLEEYKAEMALYIESISQTKKINMSSIDNYVEKKFNVSTFNQNIVGKIKEKVYGQNDAIDAICKSIFIYNSITRKDKPLNSMLFAGAEGVGKKLTAKTMADVLGFSKSKIHIDLSRYNQIDSIYSFLGKNKNEINGHNTLFEFVKRNPSSLIILENIHACHSSISDIIYQILENGKISDEYGKDIDFSRSIIVCTTSAVKSKSSLGFGFEEGQICLDDKKILPKMSASFDEVIFFSQLHKDSLSQISSDIVSNINFNHELDVDDSIYSEISSKAISEGGNASNLDRLIKSELISPLFDFMYKNSENINKNSKIHAKVLDNSVTFTII